MGEQTEAFPGTQHHHHRLEGATITSGVGASDVASILDGCVLPLFAQQQPRQQPRQQQQRQQPQQQQQQPQQQQQQPRQQPRQQPQQQPQQQPRQQQQR
ncbi:unnamed protein product [Lampetra planeri]